MSKLRRCPFCGQEAKPFKTFAGFHGVMCNTPFCCSVFGYDTKVDAIKAWNTRKPMEEIVEKLEEAAWWTESTYDEDGYSNDDGEEVVPLYRAMEIINEVCGT